MGGASAPAPDPKDLGIPALTLYVKEEMGLGKLLKEEMNSPGGEITGVYVPAAVQPAEKLNVILFLHGNKVRVWNEKGTIRDYWNLPAVPLRQGLNASKKQFILIAPTLGKTTGSEFGNLGSKIDDHLDHVLDQLQKQGSPEFKLSKTPTIDDLIIAGHSGGFGPMVSILSHIKKYKSNITEIWAFDVMYGNTAATIATQTVPVYCYFNDTETHSRALAKQNKPNIFVMEAVDFYTGKGKPSGIIGHDYLMKRFWLDRCQRIGTNGTDPDDIKRMVKG